MFTEHSSAIVRIISGASAAILLSVAGIHAQPYSSYQGSWIWQSAAGPANTWMCFRKTFPLSSVPSSAVARIAADSKYWLWVNGQQVVFEGGLKRGPNRTDSWCDEVELAKYLTTGQNCIAVQVWFWGSNGTSYNTSGSGGLYFECPVGGTVVKSDNTWRALVHPAFGRTGGPMYLPELPVIFNAAGDIGAWYTTAFDDSQWPAAATKGVPPTQPWGALWKRPIPQWKNSGLVDYVNTSKFPATSTGGDITATLPSNLQVTPYLKIDASAGLTITMKSNHDNGLYGQYVTKAGVQEWEDPSWINGENIIYSIPSGVKIQALKYRETGYTTEFAGSFSCSDAFLNTLWQKARRTVYVCMRDNIMDCPDRERAQWPGDGVNQFGGGYYCFDTGMFGLVRRMYSDLVGWSGSDGTIAGPMPMKGYNQNELPAQSMATLSEFGIWNYYLQSGDIETVRLVYPAAKKYLLMYSMGSDGLIVHRDGGWNWFDWGTVCIDGTTLENALYYSCMKSAMSMAALIGATADVATWQSRKSSIESNLKRVCLKNNSFMNTKCIPVDADNGVYETAAKPDDRANGFAVVAGLAADTTLWSGITSVLVSTFNASPYMEKYALEGLCAMGRAAEAQARMRSRYAPMVNSSYPTLWEGFGPDPSDVGTTNHGWNAGVITAMSGYMAGIGPDSAGYATYHVMPRMGSLTSIKATVASVKGSISVSLEKSPDGFALALASPSATTAMVGIPRKFDNGQGVTSITCGTQTVWSAAGTAATVQGITFKEVNASFVVFAVNPGSWKFAAGNAPAIDPLPTAAGVSSGMPAIDPARITLNGTAIRITAPAGSHVVITGIDGRTIDRATLSEGNSFAQFERHAAGMYLYRVIDNSRRCIGSGRFVLR